MHAPKAILLLASLALGLLASPISAQAGQWERIGPDTGDVRALAVAPSRTETVYSALLIAGIFRSDDRGVTWTWVGQAGPTDMGVDAASPETVYGRGGNASVIRSTDGGRQWETLLGGTEQLIVDFLLVHPRVPRRLFAALRDGRLLRSADSGETWRELRPGRAVKTLVADPGRRNVLYATVNGPGILKSVDGGAKWSLLQRGLDASGDVRALALAPSSPETLYAIQGSRLFKSSNGGERWSAAGDLPDGGEGLRQLAAEQGRRPALWLTLDRTVYRSTNEGRSWQEVRGPVLPRRILATPYGLLAGTGTGIYRSQNSGASWARSSLRGAVVSGIAAHPTAPSLYTVLVGGGVFKSPNGGARWLVLAEASTEEVSAQPNDGPTGPIAIAPSRPDTVYLGAVEGVLRSDNGGRDWTRSARIECLHAFSLAVDPTDDQTLYVTGSKLQALCGGVCLVHKSTDGGRSWSCINDGLPLFTTFRVVVHPTRPDVLYAAGGGKLFRSEDAGLSWSVLSAGVDPFVLAVSPADPNVMFAGTGGGIARSVDGGLTWSISPGSRFPPVFDLALDPADPQTVYVAPFLLGVFKSTDGGQTWSPLGSAPWPEGDILRALVVDPRDPKTVYVGSSLDGVWKLTQE